MNRAALLAEVSSDLPDNTSGSITPAIFRALLTDILNNIWTLSDSQTFSGSLAVPSGSSWNLNGILVGNGSSAVSALSVGQIPGTATNDSASSGNIGEYVTATGMTIGLTTATPANITSISLTAGDWDVWADIGFTPAASTTVSALMAGTSGISATLPTVPAGGLHEIQATLTTGVPQALPVGVERYSLAGTTTIYLVAQANFAVSTLTATGKICARRAR